jgi:O-antigen/teichoic acid export membrane protein
MSLSDEAKTKLKFVKYTLSHAPWALMTSLVRGISNYVIVILIAKFYGLAVSGQFRLLLATFGILGIFTLMDSGKVLVKYLVQNVSGVARTLYLQRLRWSFLATAIGLVIAAWYYSNGDDVWIPLVVASVCLPIINPHSLFIQVHQAKKQFRHNAFCAFLKWGTIAASVFLLAYLQVNIVWPIAAYFILGAAFNLLFFSQQKEFQKSESGNAVAHRRESLQLSGSGVFVILLDNADKFLVSYFLGLEALGLYVIGVSTGRLFLHFVKPTMTIYFPLLVKHRFTPSLLIGGFLILSAIGIAGALMMRYYFEYILGEEYLAAYPLAAIILVGLGIYFVGVINYYSAVYYKDSVAKIPAISNIITATLITAYMVVVLKFGGENALLLCAASYPLRELVTMSAITYLGAKHRRSQGTSQAG